jgi:NADPH2:quinone reductase
MRAVVLSEFGPPGNLALAEVPDPEPGPAQALVDVHVASVTFVETQVRSGRPPNPAMLPRLPAILGNGVGGIVVSVGADTDSALVGQRVVTTTGGSGGYAERALALVEASGLRAGETALVEAAAGGVGSLLVQLARAAGARVVAAAGGPRKVGVARDLGADISVDYGEPGWADRVRAQAGPVDVVFDGVGGAVGGTALGLLRQGGRFCAFGMASGSFTEFPDDQTAGRGIAVVRGAPVGPAQMRQLSAAALARAAAGTLRPLIGQTFPLDRAADAHAAIAARATVGKTLLLVRAPG